MVQMEYVGECCRSSPAIDKKVTVNYFAASTSSSHNTPPKRPLTLPTQHERYEANRSRAKGWRRSNQSGGQLSCPSSRTSSARDATRSQNGDRRR